MGDQSVDLWRMLIPSDSPTFDKFSIGAICLALIGIVGLVIRSREKGSGSAQNAALLEALVNMVTAQDARMTNMHKECMAMIQLLSDIVRDAVAAERRPLPPDPQPPAI